MPYSAASRSPDDSARRPPPSLTIVVPFALITVFLLQLAVRALRNKVATGSEALIDAIGSAKTDIAEDGRVFIHGELWNASASTRIAAEQPPCGRK